MDCEDMNWIRVLLVKDKWRALVNTAVKLPASWSVGNTWLDELLSASQGLRSVGLDMLWDSNVQLGTLSDHVTTQEFLRSSRTLNCAC